MSGTAVPHPAISLQSPRALQVAARRATLSSPQKMADIHADTQVTVEVAAWLALLKTLAGVPFAYLVPDEAMLPPESRDFSRWIRIGNTVFLTVPTVSLA